MKRLICYITIFLYLSGCASHAKIIRQLDVSKKNTQNKVAVKLLVCPEVNNFK